MYKDDIFRLILAFIFYYSVIFIQIYIGEMVTLHMFKNNLLKKNSINIERCLVKNIFLNILMSYFFGYLSALVCLSMQTKDISFIPMYIFTLIFLSPFAPKNTFNDLIVFLTALVVSIIFVFIFNFLFFKKKTKFTKKQSILISLIISILTAPYMCLFSFYGRV